MKIYMWDEGDSGYSPNSIHYDVAQSYGTTLHTKFSFYSNIMNGRKFVPNRLDDLLAYTGLRSYEEWRKSRLPDTNGWVYFIGDFDRPRPEMKIGYSEDPIGRTREGSTFNPHAILVAVVAAKDKSTEKVYHIKFNEQRVDPTREWFYYEGELKKFIEKGDKILRLCEYTLQHG